MYQNVFIILLLLSTSTPNPLPEKQSEKEEQTTETTPEPVSSSTFLSSLDDIFDNPSLDNEETPGKKKRHRPTPSPEELEERRQALILALSGEDNEDRGQISSSLMGFGLLAVDTASMLGLNANETFAPLREATQRARENFPDLGTQLNKRLKNAREYTMRAYRSLLKNARVKITNTLRFMLSAVTRLSSLIGGLYQVIVSLIDVTTRGIGTGARVGSRLLAKGSNTTVYGIAKGTAFLKNLSDSGDLVKPFSKAVMLGRELSSGLTEDFFDKVEWAQEGINSKLELVQALAPNFLLRAHETTELPSSTTPADDPIFSSYEDSDQIGGYSELNGNDHDAVLLTLASTAAELMHRGGRNANMTRTKTTMSTSTTTTTTESGVPKGSPQRHARMTAGRRSRKRVDMKLARVRAALRI